MEWPVFDGSETPLSALIKLSRFYGSDPSFVLAGGGNTSVKEGDLLRVKASGRPLSEADEESFVALRRADLEGLLAQDLGGDAVGREERFKRALLSARQEPEKGQRPSVESVLHHLIPRRFVVHTHPTAVNMLTCSRVAEARVREWFGREVLWVPYVDPGFVLARTLAQALRRYAAETGRDCPPAILMQNHGLVVGGDTPEAVRAATDRIVSKILEKIGSASPAGAFGPVRVPDPSAARRLVEILGPALRGLLADDGDRLKIVSFDDSEAAVALAAGEKGAEAAAGGPLTPDQIVYCTSFPLWFDPPEGASPEELVERLREALKGHEARTRARPHVVLVRGLGLFAAGDTPAAADTVRKIYLDAIRVMAGAARLGGVHYLGPEQRGFIEQWEAEAYRRRVAAGTGPAGRAAGKVAFVTGAAQGVGLAIARDLAAQGAVVALGDINEEGVRKAAREIAERHGPGRALGLALNVADGTSVGEALHRVVRAWGGLDLFVSNAGVLRAGSVKTQPERDFRFVTDVNYTGYFLCVQKAAPILTLQHRARPDSWSDIIQINSKSGLQGSSRNAAYAGSKFGGIGLTQSFAMELVEDGIKVNAVCPGNFLDLPLWTDPENGLFVQYLRAGKVPGARTVEDVRRFYEAKVPMGRGCRIEDLMKAIYYLMEQKYETGQALPVTGGQVMLP